MSCSSSELKSCWKTAFSWNGSVSPLVMGRVLIFSTLSVLITYLCKAFPFLRLEVGPLEVSGAVIGLLLVIRTNAGYDRWWEARKLWGGIVNQSRNLALAGVHYGPKNSDWRNKFVSEVIQFPYLTIQVLTERLDVNVAYLSSAKIANAIKAAKNNEQLDGAEFLVLEKQRASLIDHLGACERILGSPLPKVLDIKVRRFLMLYLMLVPFGLVERIGWLTPILVFFISYSLLAIDQIGIELQNPFSEKKLSSLPIIEISKNIETQINFMLNDLDFQEPETSNSTKKSWVDKKMSAQIF